MSQLTPKEIRELAACFYINVNFPGADCPQLRYMINHLPHHLHVSRMTQLLCKAGLIKKLCSVHDGLDPQTVSLIFDSLRTGVTDSVHFVRQFAYLLGPDENLSLERTASIEEMWIDSKTRFQSERNLTHHKQWIYQADQCQACMLSRVASNSGTLRELRTLILAKMDSDTSKKYRNIDRKAHPQCPLILSFINEWIQLTNQKDDLFYLSGQRAAAIKVVVHEWETVQASSREAKDDSDDQQRMSFEYLHAFQESAHLDCQTRLAVPSGSVRSLATSGAPPFGYLSSKSQSHNHEDQVSGSANLTKASPADMNPRRLPPLDDPISGMTGHPTREILESRSSLNNGEAERTDKDLDRSPYSGLTGRLNSPWSSTDALQDPRSRFSPSSTSSPGTLISVSLRPGSQELSTVSPVSGNPFVSTILPPVPSHSPLVVSPLASTRRPSTHSLHSSVSGWSPIAEQTKKKFGPTRTKML